MAENRAYEYFDTKSSKWNILGFLNQCDLEPFEKKIDCYLKCLYTISKNEQGARHERAKALLDRYKMDTQPDRKIAKNWEDERSNKQVHIHNSTFTEIGTINSDAGTVNTGTVNTGASTGCHTPERQITPEDEEKSSLYDPFPTHIYKRPEPNPFITSPQGTKHGRDIEEEEDDEYNADQTIVGGKSTDWIVNGIRIRESLTQYQLDENPPKTKPEYYDIIFFNSNYKDDFLSTLDESIVEQMRIDMRRKEEKTKDNMEQDIKIFLDNVIDRDIKLTKEKLKQQKEENITSFEKVYALEFVSRMIKLMENVNWLLDPMSEGTYIVNVLAPILTEFFTKNKQYWCASYGETCLKASARDRNSEDIEFSVTEVSGPPMKNDWTHFIGDRMKIAKMLKTLMNQFAELNPSSDITLVRLYGLQLYLNELTIYEFQLKYTEIYTMEVISTFPLPKTWADMAKAHKTVMGLLEYERLLFESMKTIKDFMWSKGGSKKMTTRMINSPTGSVKKTKSTVTTKKTTKNTATTKQTRRTTNTKKTLQKKTKKARI